MFILGYVVNVCVCVCGGGLGCMRLCVHVDIKRRKADTLFRIGLLDFIVVYYTKMYVVY